MRRNKSAMIGLFLFTVLFLAGGCVSAEKNGRAEALEKDIGGLSQLIKEKDSRIERLQELLDDQQQQLRELNDKLLKYGNKDAEKPQPNLK